jgi:hypothetical protein
VAALVNTFNKISHSVQAVDYFRSLWNTQSTWKIKGIWLVHLFQAD